MSFQDVAFLSSRVSFSATFFADCGCSESLGTTTCIKTVAGGKHGHHTPCKIPLYQSNLMESIRLFARMR